MTNDKKKILVTGAAGFIGFHLVSRLSKGNNIDIVGIDNLNNYYDVKLKYDRLSNLGIESNFYEENREYKSRYNDSLSFVKLSLEDRTSVSRLFQENHFDYVCHLAAQAGVRYSLENPYVYAESNLIGFLNILEECRQNSIKHLVYASSSSVYGLNEKMPLSESDPVNHPISLYAATKKANELMAHSYSHLFELPTTGLRFFTVYGPWGRPDMSPILFASAIQKGKPIKIFNSGALMRDFTYIDDIIEGVLKVIFKPATNYSGWDAMYPSPDKSKAPYRIYNIGNSDPVELMKFISTLENAMDKKAIKEFMPMQPGDVVKTFADVTELTENFNYHPATSLEEGIKSFVKWFKSYYL
jgi:UDP-glucuronate 4-epimerase